MYQWTILHDEATFMVVNKPTGLLSQSTFGVDSLIFQVRDWLASQNLSRSKVFAELPHRLDRGTSGAVVIAKNATTLRLIGDQFHTRKVKKAYWAAIAGCPNERQGTWVNRIKKIPNVAKAMIALPEDPEGREAILHYTTQFADESCSVHQVQIDTGRMHQIRLQFATRGFPILGDTQYGSQLPWSPHPRHAHDEHFALHAASIEFRHPKDGRPMSITAPFPDAWQNRFPTLHLSDSNKSIV